MTCTLYRFYDAGDRLLYVGVSVHGPSRWKEHQLAKPWWADVVRSTMTTLPTAGEARAAEMRAIKTEAPLYNKVGALRPVLRTVDLLTTRVSGITLEEATAKKRATEKRLEDAIVEAHKASQPVAYIAREAGMSRQAVYDLLDRRGAR